MLVSIQIYRVSHHERTIEHMADTNPIKPEYFFHPTVQCLPLQTSQEGACCIQGRGVSADFPFIMEEVLTYAYLTDQV